MGAKATFNSITRIIKLTEAPTLINGEYVVELDVQTDLYGDQKEDWLVIPELRKVRPPVSAQGGQPTPTGFLGDTYFLRAGWKIEPYDADQRLIVTGNLYSTDGSSPYTQPSGGAYSVFLESTVSNLVDSTVSELPAIQYSSYQNAVWLDITTSNSGINYPMGTREYPVNNLTDAVQILNNKGFDTIQILTSMALDAGTDLTNLIVKGKSHVDTYITIGTSAVTNNISIINCNVTGILDGGSHIINCSVGSLAYVNGHIHSSGLYGEITLDGNKDAVLANCYTIDQDSPVVIDMGSSGQDLAMPNYSGLATIKNLTSATEEIGIGLNAGMVILEDTITAGTVVIAGNGILEDNSTGNTLVNSDALINIPKLVSGVWNEPNTEYTTQGTYGAEVATKADINASTATNFDSVDSGSIVYGSVNSGTWADTVVRDNIYWQIGENATNGLTVQFDFNLPSTDHRPGILTIFGRYVGVPSSTHYLDLWAYNVESAAWELLKENFMLGGITSDEEFTHEYYERHIDRSNNNLVQMQLRHAVTAYNAAHAVYLDYVSLSSIDVITAVDIADAVFAKEVETGYTLQEAVKLITAALAGKVSGAEGTTISIRDLNDTLNRIVATVDGKGNRTSVTHDVS